MPIRLRFVSGGDLDSLAIRARTESPWSHVEAVTPAGKYLGAHAQGGVLARDPGYDASWLKAEQFVDLPETEAGQADAFYAGLEAHIGEPYDFGAILDFIVPGIEVHQARRVICSALQTLELVKRRWFPGPLAEPPHKISPRDLFLLVSARIPMQS